MVQCILVHSAFGLAQFSAVQHLVIYSSAHFSQFGIWLGAVQCSPAFGSAQFGAVRHLVQRSSVQFGIWFGAVRRSSAQFGIF